MPLKISSNEELPAINLTSMIDVLFLLIIFFMVGTRFSENEHSVPLNLSRANNPNPMMQAPASLTVSLYRDGTIGFEGRTVNANELTSILASRVQNYPDTSVQFKADSDSSGRQISSVLVAINASGVRNVGWSFVTAQMPHNTVR